MSAILLAQLYNIQIVQGEYYKTLADRQYAAPRTGAFDRGSIYFTERDGNLIGGATLDTGYTIAINPMLIDNIDGLYAKINRIVPLDKSIFFDKASKENDPYEEIAKRVTLEQVLEIQKDKIPALIIEKDKWRLYPGGRVAAHVLGFVGYKGDILIGRYGLESYYNDILVRDDTSTYHNFFAQAFTLSKNIITKDSEREGDIITSIEPTVQSILEKELAILTEKWSSELSGGVIIEPFSGEIYALANNPDYDPNLFGKEKNISVFLNPIAESTFEMGSIMKPLTLAAGIDTGAITPTTKYDDEGFIIVDGAKIKNFDKKGRGVVDVQEILDESLNTGAVFVMTKLGKKRFYDYMQRYGFDEETGIDLPGEVSGNIKNLSDNLNNKRMVEYATASFGQGIAVSPIQMARALSAIANGGYMVSPHIVKTVKYSVGFPREITASREKQVLKQSTTEELTRMLVHVVDNFLLMGSVKMNNYSIAAKTGTAQLAREDGAKGYYEDRNLHTFFGYFPAYNPRFLIFLYVKNPSGARYASQTLTNPFINMTKFLINYYNISPDR